jgi:DNA-binding transcriptional MerR regulator
MDDGSSTPTYSIGTVSRVTGLSEHVLRAWERRYGAVTPERTPGGTRRYTEADVGRLTLLARALDAGHPIGEVARLDNATLRERLHEAESAPPPALSAAMAAITRLDGPETERLISLQLAALGPPAFAREFALPLLEAIGEGWANERVCIASEHLSSALLRSLLGSSLRHTAVSPEGPHIVFATPAGDRHEFGVLIAALVAQACGANPLFLGADLPADELVHAVRTIGGAALALGVTVLEPRDLARELKAVRAGLPDHVEIWVGGSGLGDAALPAGVQRVELDQLEQKARLLARRRRPSREG